MSSFLSLKEQATINEGLSLIRRIAGHKGLDTIIRIDWNGRVAIDFVNLAGCTQDSARGNLVPASGDLSPGHALAGLKSRMMNV